MARTVYHVVPNASSWQVKRSGTVLSSHLTKPPAVEAGQRAAKGNQPSQLVVHKEDGTIEYEYTYGDDPYPPPG